MEAMWEGKKLKVNVIVITIILYYFVVATHLKLQCSTPEKIWVLKYIGINNCILLVHQLTYTEIEKFRKEEG